MADAIKDGTGIEAEMIEGSGGIFDVRVDDDLIYCKKETGVFPEHSLIVEKINAISKVG